MIKEHIRQMGAEQVVMMITGTVGSVDKTTDTMLLTPLDGSADYMAVKLEAMVNTSDGRSDMVRYPAVGCIAIIGLLNNNPLNTFLIKASKYESVSMLIAQSAKITITGDGLVTVDAKSIVLNGGNNNGLVNILPLVSKINRLEQTLNLFLSAFKTHIHPATSGTTSPTVTPTPGAITPMTKSKDLEDTKIKH